MDFYMYWIHFFQIWNILFLVLTVVVILVSAVCYYIYNIHSTYDHIPGPPRDGFLSGNLPLLIKEVKKGNFFQQILLNLSKQYGNTFKVMFFHQLFVVTSDPDAVKNLLVTGHHKKSKAAMEPITYLWGTRFIGNGLVAETHHKKWAFRRALMNPCFQRGYLRKLTTEFNIESDLLMTRLTNFADGKTKVTLMKELNRITLDILGKIAFGIEIDSLQSEDNEFTKAILLAFKGFSKKVNATPLFIINPFNWKFIWDVRKACKFLRTFGNKILKERTEAKDRGHYIPDDVLTHIIKIKEENPELDNEEIIDDFVTFFVAGQETTANLLGFVIEYLCRNRDVLKRLRTEIDDVVGEKNIIQYSDIDRLVYLDMVIKETLRLASPASTTFRELEKDEMIGGFKVPKGSTVMVSGFISGRSKEFFEAPDKFDPERFSPLAEKRVNTYAYFPFTLGPRTCIGKHFADMEAKIIITKFIQRFDFNMDISRPLEFEEITTIRPKGGVVCTLSLREEKQTGTY